MKITYYTLLFCIFTFSIYCQDYNTYNSEIIEFIDNDFTFDFHSFGINGPTALAFKETGELIINDPLGNRIKLYNSSMRLVSIILKNEIGYSDGYICSNNILLARDKSGTLFTIIWLDKNDFCTIIYSDLNVDIDDSKTVYLGDVLFINTNTPSMFSIPNPVPDPDENNRLILDAAQTRNLFLEPEKYDLEGVTIDSQNRIFLNGVLQTRDYKTYIEYWRKLNGGNIFNRTILKRTAEEFLDNGYTKTYIGRDTNSNIYWDVNQGIIVFNVNGELIEIFVRYRQDRDKNRTSYAVHPSGDLYFLDYDQKGVYLYRIKNTWDPEGRAKWFSEHRR